MQIIQIKNELLQSASYLIDGCYLIDCGSSQFVFDAIGHIGKELKGIFLSHCHYDHIYGLNEVLEYYPKMKVYCSELTKKGLIDEEMNLSYIFSEYSFKFKFINNIVVLNGGKHSIGELNVEVIPTPGHSDDSLTYIIGNHVFTGDSYIPLAKTFTKWPRSSKQQAIENELKLKLLIEERNLIVCPGHW